MNIKKFFKNLRDKKKDMSAYNSTTITNTPSDHFADVNKKVEPYEWTPYDRNHKPRRSGWYAVVYGTRCQIKWYNQETDTWSKIPLNYPVTFFLVLPPLPVMGRPIDKE